MKSKQSTKQQPTIEEIQKRMIKLFRYNPRAIQEESVIGLFDYDEFNAEGLTPTMSVVKKAFKQLKEVGAVEDEDGELILTYVPSFAGEEEHWDEIIKEYYEKK